MEPNSRQVAIRVMRLSRLDRRAVKRASDAEVIALSLDDGEKFVELYERHSSRLFSYLSRRFPDALAQDLTSETFVTAFENRRRFDQSYADAAPWLFGIAANVSRRHFREEVKQLKLASHGGLALVEPDSVGETDDRVDAASSATALTAAIASMSDPQREVLTLWVWGDLKYEEIAVALDVPIGTVRSRLARARTDLRAALNPADVSISEESPKEEART